MEHLKNIQFRNYQEDSDFIFLFKHLCTCFHFWGYFSRVIERVEMQFAMDLTLWLWTLVRITWKTITQPIKKIKTQLLLGYWRYTQSKGSCVVQNEYRSCSFAQKMQTIAEKSLPLKRSISDIETTTFKFEESAAQFHSLV